MSNSGQPYLSIVVTTRNDNHGGDLLLRTQTYVKGLIHQCNKFNFFIELIVVEWNPPVGKPLLNEVLPQPLSTDKLSLRYIVVPNEIHQQYISHNSIPLFQMIAKNVGIRRAKGEYILCTNIDILFTDECFARMAKCDFQPHSFYRANRLDVDKGLLQVEGLEAQLDFAQKHVIKRLGKNADLKHVRGLPAFFFGFTNSMKILDYFWGFVDRLVQGDSYALNQLDTMACGDFTIMHKEAWLAIDGYVELDMYSIHIDSMALYAAQLQSMKQEIFHWKEVVYHIDHADGWETITDAAAMLRFLAKKPGLDWWLVVKATIQLMKEGKIKFELNKPTWGFSEHQFEEIVFNP
jgi:hypothetical protein